MWMQGQNSIEDIIEEKTPVLIGSNTGPSHYIVNDNKKTNLDLNRTQDIHEDTMSTSKIANQRTPNQVDNLPGKERIYTYK